RKDTMADEESFLLAIDAGPRDADLRLVFADWLEENAQDDKAEYQRPKVRCLYRMEMTSEYWDSYLKDSERSDVTTLARVQPSNDRTSPWPPGRLPENRQGAGVAGSVPHRPRPGYLCGRRPMVRAGEGAGCR